jgi:hypothetical protein
LRHLFISGFYSCVPVGMRCGWSCKGSGVPVPGWVMVLCEMCCECSVAPAAPRSPPSLHWLTGMTWLRVPGSRPPPGGTAAGLRHSEHGTAACTTQHAPFGCPRRHSLSASWRCILFVHAAPAVTEGPPVRSHPAALLLLGYHGGGPGVLAGQLEWGVHACLHCSHGST